MTRSPLMWSVWSPARARGYTGDTCQYSDVSTSIQAWPRAIAGYCHGVNLEVLHRARTTQLEPIVTSWQTPHSSGSPLGPAAPGSMQVLEPNSTYLLTQSCSVPQDERVRH